MTPERHDEPAALLPWYLNGTLSDAERERVEAWLRAAPEREADLTLWRAVQADVRIAPICATVAVSTKRTRSCQ